MKEYQRQDSENALSLKSRHYFCSTDIGRPACFAAGGRLYGDSGVYYIDYILKGNGRDQVSEVFGLCVQ